MSELIAVTYPPDRETAPRSGATASTEARRFRARGSMMIALLLAIATLGERAASLWQRVRRPCSREGHGLPR